MLAGGAAGRARDGSMSGLLIKKTYREIKRCCDYGGVCHKCNSPVSYQGEMFLIEIEETSEYWRAVPVDEFRCPFCDEIVYIIKIYKSLDVTKELTKV